MNIIIEELKKLIKNGNIITKLILINLSIFLLINIFRLIFFLIVPTSIFDIVDFLAVPSSLSKLIFRFWTPFTYMFLHVDFLHIVFNMLWFYWFAQIFLMNFDEKKLLGIYLLGGLAGAAFYIISFNIFPVFQQYVNFSVALGASASVMAVVIATSTYTPNYTLNLLIIGQVKLKYIAIFAIILDIISIPKENPGGHIAHLGGAVLGLVFALQMRNNVDITKGFNSIMDTLFSWIRPRPKMKVTYKATERPKPPRNEMDYNRTKADQQAEIDKILDKISKYGYNSLTNEEKDILFRASDKKK